MCVYVMCKMCWLSSSCSGNTLKTRPIVMRGRERERENENCTKPKCRKFTALLAAFSHRLLYISVNSYILPPSPFPPSLCCCFYWSLLRTECSVYVRPFSFFMSFFLCGLLFPFPVLARNVGQKTFSVNEWDVFFLSLLLVIRKEEESVRGREGEKMSGKKIRENLD